MESLCLGKLALGQIYLAKDVEGRDIIVMMGADFRLERLFQLFRFYLGGNIIAVGIIFLESMKDRVDVRLARAQGAAAGSATRSSGGDGEPTHRTGRCADARATA